jgi:hypothetical protein
MRQHPCDNAAISASAFGNLAILKILLAVLRTWRSRSIKSYIPSCSERISGEHCRTKVVSGVELVEPISPVWCHQISELDLTRILSQGTICQMVVWRFTVSRYPCTTMFCPSLFRPLSSACLGVALDEAGSREAPGWLKWGGWVILFDIYFNNTTPP